MTVYVDLVLDTIDLVRIECPNKYEDALHEALEQLFEAVQLRGDLLGGHG